MGRNQVAERLKRFRESLNLTQAEMAEAMHMKQGSYSDVERGKVKVSGELLKQLIQEYRISPIWLYEGTGKTTLENVHLNVHPNVHPKSKNQNETYINSVYEEQALYQRVAMPSVVTVDETGRNTIPVIDVQAAAGFPAHYQDEMWYQERPHFTLPWPEAQQYTYICLQASGDSMHPTIYHHDWLIARFIDDPSHIQEGYVHIILTQEGPVVKRVLNRIQERQALALQSDNDQYPTYDQPISSILALYHVQYRLSANLRNENAGLLQRIQRLEDRYNRIEDRLSGN